MKKFKPPRYAIENAKKAKECLDKGSDAMLTTGRKRMNQLIRREDLSKYKLAKIHKFRRHKSNASYKGDYCEDRGAVAWLGWGNSLSKGKGKPDFSNWAKKRLK